MGQLRVPLSTLVIVQGGEGITSVCVNEELNLLNKEKKL